MAAAAVVVVVDTKRTACVAASGRGARTEHAGAIVSSSSSYNDPFGSRERLERGQ